MSSAAPPDPSSGKMASHLRNCAQLDRQIREEAKQRSIFDPELRRLRSSLRSECEAALLADFRLSQVQHCYRSSRGLISMHQRCTDQPARLRRRCLPTSRLWPLAAQVHRGLCLASTSPVPSVDTCRSTMWSSCCGKQFSTAPLRSSGQAAAREVALVGALSAATAAALVRVCRQLHGD